MFNAAEANSPPGMTPGDDNLLSLSQRTTNIENTMQEMIKLMAELRTATLSSNQMKDSKMPDVSMFNGTSEDFPSLKFY